MLVPRTMSVYTRHPLKGTSLPTAGHRLYIGAFLPISTAVTFLASFNIKTVKFPVPGPTSSTWSDCLRPAFATMAEATPGFLRIC